MHRDGAPALPEALARMSAAIAHRGGDASGLARDGAVGMAHRMLWSTAESIGERQPVVRDAPAAMLVADARLDNRGELISLLRVPDPTTASDSEILLAAYGRWGARCVEHIIGDFAFAVWDRRAHVLFCARDPMGVKPLYYHVTERLFAFASEAKALLALPGVPGDVDALQIALYIEGIPGDRSRTQYSAIRRLPAAHTMVVGARDVATARYWSAADACDSRPGSATEHAEEFREIFERAVRARLRSAHPVGAALSGGLDSASIVCTARRIQAESMPSPLHTFSLVFPSLPAGDLQLIDERPFIDSVVRGGGVLPTFLRGDELSPVAEIDAVLARLDEPYAAPNLYLHWAMYRASSERGARVFLDGFDGDTAVSHGFARLNGIAMRGEWELFEREVRALAARRRVHPNALLSHFGLPYLSSLAKQGAWGGWIRSARELVRRFDLSFSHTLLHHALRPAAPAFARAAWRAIHRTGDEPGSLVNGRLQNLLLESGMRAADGDTEDVCTERESHLTGLAQPAYQQTLELADQCAAVFGVEPRYPFFDRRLIEFCVSLPDAHKLADGWPRLTFRRAMDGVLPADIRWRSDKGNLSPNFHRALRISQAVLPDPSVDSPLAAYINLDALRSVRARYCAAPTTLARSAEGHALYRVMVLERWLTLNRAADTTAQSPSPSPTYVAA